MGVGPPPLADYFSPPPGLDALAPPGSLEFFPSVIDRIHQLLPAFPLDRVILQSILLSILAGNKSLVLRTKEEDVGLVQNLASLLLAHVFGYTTHKHKVAPSTPRTSTPPSFITSLFFSPRKDRAAAHKPRRPSGRRSRTFPAPHPPDPDTEPRPPPPPLLLPTRPPLRPAGPHSDPLTAASGDAGSVLSFRSAEPPQALVVAGLEHASAPCQRALLDVLHERAIAPELVEGNGAGSPAGCKLPDNFVCVYVCPFDPYERPRIHRNLVSPHAQLFFLPSEAFVAHAAAQLDKFALSATIAVSAPTRQAYTAYLTTLPPALPTAASPLSPHTDSPPLFPSYFFTRLRALSTPAHTHADARLGLFLTRLFSAARHHPALDAGLLTPRAMQDARALARAHRVLGGAEGGEALVAAAAVWDDTDGSEARSADVDVDAEAEGDIRGGRQVRVQLLSDGASTARSSEAQEKASAREEDVVSGAELAWLRGELDVGVLWDLSEADVGKVAPRVLSHRLRVRDGPEDEVLASVVFSACGRAPRDLMGGTEGEGGRRQTVKDILVQLFKDI
ncbi:hypothetical protein K488DRAFT_68061 [Vararia minispora EC-137]|uniref:Uncharacterized protein n=1 Tax=Vararia minispora EC-137 TaxID=1314806 RepID=A0ACB8QX02_9AGAM|nr:hypothetical protein K488DRAFT_68061 [Vararia minispora EC-137]